MDTGHHPSSFSRRNTQKDSGLRCPASALSMAEEEGVARREMEHQDVGRSHPTHSQGLLSLAWPPPRVGGALPPGPGPHQAAPEHSLG